MKSCRTREQEIKSFSCPLVLLSIFSCSLVWSAPVEAQSFEVGGHVSVSQWSDVDGNDVGVGGRFTFKPLPLVGIEAELTWYPGDFPPDTVASFSGRRLEGLFGVTAGPKLGRLRPFGKAAAGFLDIGTTPRAFACVAIFPPPLTCTLAGGPTLPAYEIGGGIEIDASSKTFVRADVSDRILKYPGPTFDANFERHDDGFLGGAMRFTLGGGIRF
jgi:hypothetical protein